jgi:hypothetical protein
MRLRHLAVLAALLLAGCTSAQPLVLPSSVPLAPGSASAEPPSAAPADGFVPLFNGTDLDGWRVVLGGKEADAGTTFTVRDGTITISGNPVGYIVTKKSYRNYTIRYEWRYATPVGSNNSGLLVHIQQLTHPGPWPTCVEVQGMQSDATMLLPIGAPNPQVTSDKAAITRAVRPADWNTTEVVSADGTLTTALNGVPVGSGHTDLKEGTIGIQSEGAVLQVRNIQIKAS